MLAKPTTLLLPQPLDSSASPTFAGLTVTNGTNSFGFTPADTVFNISGPATTIAQAPRITFSFNGDADPAIGYLVYDHDSMAITFDSYWNNASWVSSDVGSNFAIYKITDELRIGWKAGIAKGSTFAGFELANAVRFSNDGKLGIGVAAGAQKLNVNGDINLPEASYYRIGGFNILRAGSAVSLIALGHSAGALNTTGTLNTALGSGALQSNIAGHYNTAVGYRALQVTTATGNTAVGVNSTVLNVGGTYNTAVGLNSLYTNVSGSLCVAIGFAALELSLGSTNIGVGYRAGDNITSGANNIVIGSNIDAPVATSSNQLSIGNLIFGTGVDGTGVGISSGNIGIGVINPLAKLHLPDDTYIGFGAVPDVLIGYDSSLASDGGLLIDLTGSASQNLIIESTGNVNTFFIEGSSGRLGVGTATLAAQTHLTIDAGTVRTGMQLSMAPITAAALAGLKIIPLIKRSSAGGNVEGLLIDEQLNPSGAITETGIMYCGNFKQTVKTSNALAITFNDFRNVHSSFSLEANPGSTNNVVAAYGFISSGLAIDTGGGGVWTNFFHYYAKNSVISGHITNQYGIAIEKQTTGSAINIGLWFNDDVVAGSGVSALGAAAVFGAGRDMANYYDGVNGVIDTSIVAASDLNLYCGASKTLVLQSAVYEDIVLAVDGARVPASNAPAWESFIGNLSAYAYEVNDYQPFTAELVHGYKTGSTFEFHVHGALNATVGGGDETVKFEIEYSVADMDPSDGLGDVFPATTTINAEFVVPATTPDLTNIFISIGTDATGNFGMGATVKGRIRRIASSGTELAGDIFVTQVGLHYQKDTMGSRQMTVK